MKILIAEDDNVSRLVLASTLKKPHSDLFVTGFYLVADASRSRIDPVKTHSARVCLPDFVEPTKAKKVLPLL